MRHRQKSERFSRPEGQRRALKKSLLRALLIEERIKTSHTQAKALTSWVADLITLAKIDTLHNRRQAYEELNDHRLTKRLFEVVAPRFKEIYGGYTRMFDVGLRKGDGNLLSLIEFTKREEKGKKTKKGKKAAKESKETEQSQGEEKKPAKKGIAAGVKKLFNKKEKNRQEKND